MTPERLSDRRAESIPLICPLPDRDDLRKQFLSELTRIVGEDGRIWLLRVPARFHLWLSAFRVLRFLAAAPWNPYLVVEVRRAGRERDR